MQDSKVIEVDGIFVGAAVSLPGTQGWRFVAADIRLGGLDGQVMPTLGDTRRVAKQALLSARMVRPHSGLVVKPS